MTLWTRKELINALENEIIDYDLSEEITIDEVVIDSRKTPKSGLFLAIKGEKNDAHNFLKQAHENGCVLMLVQDKESLEAVPKCDFILVKNTFTALYLLAEFSRNRSAAKIIAITGSVGKTGTKEMLKLAFLAYGKTFATYGNLNNHIGVPLSLCNFAADCKFGIFEMGMNHLNEIEPLSRLTKPHLAIITNVGPVHIEYFKNEEEIALAKSEIFSGLHAGGIALINRDNHHFEFLEKRARNLRLHILSFGKNPDSDYCLKASHIKAVNSSEIFLKIRHGEEVSYKISASSKTVIFNSTIIAACLDVLTDNPKPGLEKLENLEDTAGRGKAFDVEIEGNKKITIIDDSYNASVLSMYAGLEYGVELKSALRKKRVIAALGDMLELGEKSVELHEEITNYLKQFHIDFTILVGEQMTEAAKKLSINSYKTFADSSLASVEIQDLLKDGDILYIKGSRGMKMEKIIEKLTNKINAH